MYASSNNRVSEKSFLITTGQGHPNPNPVMHCEVEGKEFILENTSIFSVGSCCYYVYPIQPIFCVCYRHWNIKSLHIYILDINIYRNINFEKVNAVKCSFRFFLTVYRRYIAGKIFRAIWNSLRPKISGVAKMSEHFPQRKIFLSQRECYTL